MHGILAEGEGPNGKINHGLTTPQHGRSFMRISIYQFFVKLPHKLREEDKIKHIYWSFFMLLFALLFIPMPQALAVVMLLGLVKEIWDEYYGSGFCLFDITGNVLGCVSAMACWQFVQWAL
jgi:hypothetical protein